MSIVQRLRSHGLYLLSPTWEKTGLPGGAVVKNLPTRAGEARELGSIPGLGRSLGVGNGNPLQYSCLENPTDRGVWWATVHGVARSQTQISIHTTDQLRKDKASQMKRMFRRFDCCFFPNRPLGKESACNARDPSLIPGSGKQRGYPLQYSWAFLLARASNESSCNVGDMGSIPGLGRFPGERKVYPLQSSALENSMDCIAHGFAKSQTRLSDFHFRGGGGSGLHQEKHACGHADGRPTYRHYSCCLRSHNSHFAKVYVFQSWINSFLYSVFGAKDPKLPWQIVWSLASSQLHPCSEALRC